MLITNFKATETAVGENAVSLAKIHEKVAEETGANIIVAVQTADIYRVAQSVQIPVFAQRAEPVKYGSHTGWTLPESLIQAGAKGVILHHSERRFDNLENLGATIERCKEIGLYVVCCAENADEGAEIMQKYSPDLIAVEPPELIGGDISVSTAKPELIEESVQKIGENKVLVGAGVKNAQDVKIASKFGAVGILVASGVTKSNNPEAAILDLISGL